MTFNLNYDFRLGEISLEEISGFVKKHYVLAGCALAIGGGYLLLRKFRAGGVCRCATRLEGKTVIITGANVGLGKATALNLANRGARIIMACRDVLKGERVAEYVRRETNNGNVFVLQLDLASFKSIRKFASQIHDRKERVDILVNNAGVVISPKMLTEEGFEMMFGVNHLGHFLLTHLLLDVMKECAPSRIVVVASGAHRSGRMNWDDLNFNNGFNSFASYQQSKLANVLFTRALSNRLTGTGVTVNAVHPGIVDTAAPRHLYTSTWLKYIATVMVINLFSKTSTEGCQTQVHVAVCPDLELVSGKYFTDCKEKPVAPHACNTEDEERLWTLSLQMTGLEEN